MTCNEITHPIIMINKLVAKYEGDVIGIGFYSLNLLITDKKIFLPLKQ